MNLSTSSPPQQVGLGEAGTFDASLKVGNAENQHIVDNFATI